MARRIVRISYDGGADVFCHYSGVEIEAYKTLKEGDVVGFDIVRGPNGNPQADHVLRIDSK